MYSDIATLCIHSSSTLGQAMTCMEKNRLGIVLVVDEAGHLQGTIPPLFFVRAGGGL